MITRPVPEHDKFMGLEGALGSARGRRCFLCGEPTTDPAILWSPAVVEIEQIVLHPPCVVHLAYALLRDLKELNRQQAAS